MSEFEIYTKPGPYIVAEIGASHNGDLNTAMQLLETASKAGADAVKVQCWTDGTMVLGDDVIQGGPWHGIRMRELYHKAWLPWAFLTEMFDRARDLGTTIFSSVFDYGALQFLENRGCPIYKIASCEIVDLPLIDAVASTKKPIVISTGAANLSEINNAVDAAARHLPGDKITLLACHAVYPAPLALTRARGMTHIGFAKVAHYGLSDHTPRLAAPIEAAMRGAEMIEKHIRLDDDTKGLDSGFAMPVSLLGPMATACREISVLNSLPPPTQRQLSEAEAPVRALRRSMHYARDLPAGHVLTDNDVVTARPANGANIAGWTGTNKRVLQKAVKAGDPCV